MKVISEIFREKNAKIIVNNIYNFLGFLIPAVLTFLVTPYLVSGLGVVDYGLWNVTLSFLGLMGILELGIGVSITKYVSEYIANDDKQALSSTITMGFIINLGLSILIVIPLYFFAPQITAFLFSKSESLHKTTQIIRIMTLGFFPLMIRNAGLAIPAGLQKYQIVNIIKIIQNALTMIVAIIVISLQGTIYDVVTSTVILMWVIGITSLVICYRLLQPLDFHWIISRSAAKTIFSYMAASGITNIGIKLFSSVDKLVVGTVLGLANVTYYSIAIGIANKFVTMSSALTQALMPAASEMYTRGEEGQLRKILFYSTAVLFFINAIPVGLLLVFADEFLVWWLDPDLAQQVISPLRILVLIYGIRGITAPAFYIVNGIGKPWINSIVTAIQGVGIILLIFYLGSQFGIMGAVWANAITWVEFAMVIYIIHFLMQPQRKHAEKFQ